MVKPKQGAVATQEMVQKAPKKGSVLFESADPNAFLTSAYVIRSGMAKQLDISDLDSVKKIRVTLEVIE